MCVQETLNDDYFVLVWSDSSASDALGVACVCVGVRAGENGSREDRDFTVDKPEDQLVCFVHAGLACALRRPSNKYGGQWGVSG